MLDSEQSSSSSHRHATGLELIGTQCVDIVPVLLKVLLKAEILVVDRILVDIGNEDQSDDTAENAKS